jgi:hypothetical protein
MGSLGHQRVQMEALGHWAIGQFRGVPAILAASPMVMFFTRDLPRLSYSSWRCAGVERRRLTSCLVR